MCYEERLFRSWATKKTQKREKNQAPAERDRLPVTAIPAAPAPETKHRKEVERELEEIV